MALRAMYKGFKKVLTPLIIKRPGVLAIDQDALNIELDKIFYPRSEEAVMGSTNQMPFPYYSASGYESQSVTYTYDAEGKISAEGISAGDSTFYLFRQVPASQLYKFNGWFLKGLTGGTQSKVFLTLNQSTSPWTSYAQNIDGATQISGIPNDSTPVDCSFKIASGYSFSGVVKPMITLSANAPFAPFVMTNQQLTDNVASRVIFKTLSGGDLDDILTTGWYSWGGTAPTHSPQGVAYSCMQCIVETGVQKQIVYFGADTIYMRQRSGSPAAWGSWYKFSGTIVS